MRERRTGFDMLRMAVPTHVSYFFFFFGEIKLQTYTYSMSGGKHCEMFWTELLGREPSYRSYQYDFLSVHLSLPTKECGLFFHLSDKSKQTNKKKNLEHLIFSFSCWSWTVSQAYSETPTFHRCISFIHKSLFRRLMMSSLYFYVKLVHRCVIILQITIEVFVGQCKI